MQHAGRQPLEPSFHTNRLRPGVRDSGRIEPGQIERIGEARREEAARLKIDTRV